MHLPSNMGLLMKILEHQINGFEYMKIFDMEGILLDGEVGVEIGYGSKNERRDPQSGVPSEMISVSLFKRKLADGDAESVVYLFKDYATAIQALSEWEEITLQLRTELRLDEQLEGFVTEFEEYIFSNGLGKYFQGNLDDSLWE